MDFTNLPNRLLIYRPRTSLKDFTEHNDLNRTIVDNLVEVPYFQSPDFKRRTLTCMNEAYYICTMMLRDEQPLWSLPAYKDIAFCGEKNNVVNQAATLSMVSIYMRYFSSEWLQRNKRMKDKLSDTLSMSYLRSGDPFLDDYSYANMLNDLSKDLPSDFIMPADEFAFRKIDRDIFKDVDGSSCTWTQYTNYYESTEVWKIIKELGKNEDEKYLLLELIDRDAQRFYANTGHYHETVHPMLLDMEDSLRLEYHYEESKELFEAEMAIKEQEEQDRRQLMADLQATVDQLTEENKALREQLTAAPPQEQPDNGETLEQLRAALAEYESQPGHLTAKQCAIIVKAVLWSLDVTPKKMGDLGIPLHLISGFGKVSCRNHLNSKITESEIDTLHALLHNQEEYRDLDRLLLQYKNWLKKRENQA